MDNAVALVQAYLHINGYFSVAEYPVIEAVGRGKHYRMATDLDILAFRFPGAGRLIPGREGDEMPYAPDPVLRCPHDQADMLVGEVKEGHAALNRAATDPSVLRTMLARFGCCSMHDSGHLVQQLIRKGKATTPSGHRVRLVAFGSGAVSAEGRNYQVIDLGHVVQFLQEYLRQHWEVLHHAQFKDPALGFLMTLEKAAGDSRR
ncbi:MAG: hypothetical protein L3J28_07645 [Candidatus Polarisedimenticolaceae bacterium]|nr:hypothetical protein [Candidatus Polarisedimenticolaceae bacterium]